MNIQKTAFIAIVLGLSNLLLAALPEITAEQLIAAAVNADGNYQNLRATYQVDEQFNHRTADLQVEPNSDPTKAIATIKQLLLAKQYLIEYSI